MTQARTIMIVCAEAISVKGKMGVERNNPKRRRLRSGQWSGSKLKPPNHGCSLSALPSAAPAASCHSYSIIIGRGRTRRTSEMPRSSSLGSATALMMGIRCSLFARCQGLHRCAKWLAAGGVSLPERPRSGRLPTVPAPDTLGEKSDTPSYVYSGGR